ncbi:hypothetical protein MBLNU13_g10386t1 [Cladosporium sp. NU13]
MPSLTIKPCLDENLVQPLRKDGSDGQKAKPEIIEATTLHMSNPPYENYSYPDRHVAVHVVVTSPVSDSDLSIDGPRLIVAWPAGNSRACMIFQPADGVNGSLHIEVINSTVGFPLAPINIALDGYPGKGVEGAIKLDTAATLPPSILGSVRAICDFTEVPSLLYPKLHEGIKTAKHGTSGVAIRVYGF